MNGLPKDRLALVVGMGILLAIFAGVSGSRKIPPSSRGDGVETAKPDGRAGKSSAPVRPPLLRPDGVPFPEAAPKRGQAPYGKGSPPSPAVAALERFSRDDPKELMLRVGRDAVFRGGYAPFQENKKWGFVDTRGVIILPPQFDGIWHAPNPPLQSDGLHFVDDPGDEDGDGRPDLAPKAPNRDWSCGFAPGVFPVRVGVTWGIIASSGRWLITPDLDEIRIFGKALARFRRGEKVGFLDRNGVVIGESYDDSLESRGGLAPVKKGHLWGYIDSAGTNVIPPRFMSAFPFEFDRAPVIDWDGQWGFIRPDGSWIATYSFFFREQSGLFSTFRDGLTGLFSLETGEIASPAFHLIMLRAQELFLVTKNFQQGLMDAHGKVLLPCEYGEINIDEREARADGSPWPLGVESVRFRKGALWGFCHRAGRRFVPPTFQHLGPFRDGRAAALVHGRWGFIDPRGQWVVPATFDWAGDFPLVPADGPGSAMGLFAAVVTATECFIIDREGKRLAHPPFQNVSDRALPNGNRRFKHAGRYGFIRPDGSIAIPPRYEEAEWFEETGVVLAREDKRWWVLSPTGGERPEHWFTDKGRITGDRCWVRVPTGQVGFIDSQGSVVIPPEYDWVADFRDGRALVRKNGKWGIIDTRGVEVVPLVYDSLTGDQFGKGLWRAVRDGVTGMLDGNGTFFPPEAAPGGGSFSREGLPK